MQKNQAMQKKLRPSAAPANPARPNTRQSPNGEVEPNKEKVDEIAAQEEAPPSTARAEPRGRVKRKRPEEKGPQQGQGGRPGG